MYDETRKIGTYRPTETGSTGVTLAFPGNLLARGAWSPDNVSLHANMETVFSFYDSVLHRNSFDGHGAQVNQTMDIDYNGSLPGGEYDNASWNPGQQLFMFGNPYVTALDVVGHEFTHAVINYVVGDGYYSTLEYYKESGALNESLADIMGALIEGKADIGKLGEDIGDAHDGDDNNDDEDGLMRSMENPSLGGQPDRYDAIGSEEWDTYLDNFDRRDNEGVHIYSGIFNHAADLMITDPRTSGVSYERWAMVFYKSMHRLVTNSTFLDARGAVIASAKLLGFNHDQQQAIKDAFDTVGIKEKDSIRIVLTWGATPHDLDSHLVGPGISGGSRFHVYFVNRNYYETGSYASEGSLYAADLDYDDVTSYGPEVTTIRILTPGAYYFYVHDYSNLSDETSTAMSLSGASVSVYVGDVPAPTATYTIRHTYEGIYWNVLRLDIDDSRNVTLTPIDTFSGEAIYS
jgi:hypothetical protein